MSRIKRLLKKVDKIVENIDIQEVINKIQEDTEEELHLQQSEIKVCYEIDKEKYKVSSINKYNNYECYNNYDVEEESWTSLKAS